MEIAPMTKRDKILLYVVLMLAFVVLFVRFLLIPGIENHQQADADLREAQDAQTSMQDAIMLAGTYAAEKNNNWGELQTANASYYSLLSSDELDTLVTSLELNHNLQPDSLTIGEPVTQSLTIIPPVRTPDRALPPAQPRPPLPVTTTVTTTASPLTPPTRRPRATPFCSRS